MKGICCFFSCTPRPSQVVGPTRSVRVWHQLILRASYNICVTHHWSRFRSLPRNPCKSSYHHLPLPPAQVRSKVASERQWVVVFSSAFVQYQGSIEAYEYLYRILWTLGPLGCTLATQGGKRKWTQTVVHHKPAVFPLTPTNGLV